MAISSDGKYAAIAIENERDEDVSDGEMPQDPSAEPEYVSINANNWEGIKAWALIRCN